MKNYSQNNEQDTILNYFGAASEHICFLDIGCNDGLKFSNTFALSLHGSKGLLVEPAPIAFERLIKNYHWNEYVILVNAAIGGQNGEAVFYDSGQEDIHKGGISLLSTLNKEETKRWSSVAFREIEVKVITFEKLLKDSPYKTFQFISIDAEGEDVQILKQIDLGAVGCVCVCVEWNSKPEVLQEIKNHCRKFGLENILLINSENIVIGS